MDKIKLKDCPFCGGEAVIHINEEGVRVICTKCETSTQPLVDGYSAKGPSGTALYTVIDRWNKREREKESDLSCKEDVIMGKNPLKKSLTDKEKRRFELRQDGG